MIKCSFNLLPSVRRALSIIIYSKFKTGVSACDVIPVPSGFAAVLYQCPVSCAEGIQADERPVWEDKSPAAFKEDNCPGVPSRYVLVADLVGRPLAFSSY